MVAVRQAGSPYRGTTYRQTWNGARIAGEIDAAVQRAMNETADAMETTAQSLARVDTGRMRAGLTATVSTTGGGRRQIVMYGEAPYTIFHELGTSRISAQPMIRPAIDQEAPRLTERIRAATSSIR